jgi:hypothetical protein
MPQMLCNFFFKTRKNMLATSDFCYIIFDFNGCFNLMRVVGLEKHT